MQKGLSFIGCSLIGAVVGGLFHLISNKPENKIETPVIQDDNKGAENAVISETSVDSGSIS